MKKMILVLTLLVLMVRLFGQNPTQSREYYLQKSKNQKTTGWVLLAGGTAMAITGAIIFENSDLLSDDPSSENGALLFAGGVVADLVSIPFFISGAKNAGKAAAISFSNQKALVPQRDGLAMKVRPSITLRITL